MLLFFFQNQEKRCLFDAFFLKKKDATVKQRHFNPYILVSLGDLDFGYQIHWLYRTSVGLPFALRSPALTQLVNPTNGETTSVPISLVGFSTDLHTPRVANANKIKLQIKFTS